jgi:glycosyltransferase involved in cell wall biosynthesis
MGPAQALGSVVDAAKILMKLSPSVRLSLIGGGVDKERLEARVAEEGISNLRFLPRRSLEEMGPVMYHSDALLVSLADDDTFRTTIPSKTQAYMAAGRPVVMSARGDAAALVNLSGGGVVVEPEDPPALATAIANLQCLSREELDAVGGRARMYYEENLAMIVGTSNLIRILETAARKVRVAS